ncbi:MAG: hypothetical protein RLZZ450_326 [Pseudomonadota bacterium]|jgi:hypothetical protein
MQPDFGFFEVDVWGNYVGTGVSGARGCTMGGVVKVGDITQPYLVANELISARLAQLLALPVPPGVVAQVDAGEYAYVSLRFGKKGARPPPTIPKHLVSDNPHMAAGIIAFDCWIANTDRHDGNLAYSRDYVGIQLFDHGHALLGAEPGLGTERLLRYADHRPVVSSCLAPHVTMSQPFLPWAERIGSVHDDIIRDLVASGAACGLTGDEANEAAEFLIKRKSRILDLLRSAKQDLPEITDWT